MVVKKGTSDPLRKKTNLQIGETISTQPGNRFCDVKSV